MLPFLQALPLLVVRVLGEPNSDPLPFFLVLAGMIIFVGSIVGTATILNRRDDRRERESGGTVADGH